MLFSDLIPEDADFIPLISEDEIESSEIEELPDTIPVLPLRNTVLFPGIVIPISVGREKSVKLIRDSFADTKLIGTVAQKDMNIEEPTLEDIHTTGTIARIAKILEMPDGSTTVIIQGRNGFAMKEVVSEKPYIKATYEVVNELHPEKEDKEFKAVIESVRETAIQIINLSPNTPKEAVFAIKNIDKPYFLINYISTNMELPATEKQKLLEENKMDKRAMLLLEFLSNQVDKLTLQDEVQSKVKTQIDKQHREFLLNQQIKTIQEELGNNPVDLEVETLLKAAEKKKWSDKVAEFFNKELDKLKRLNPASPDYSVQLNYLQLITELPWNEYTKDNFDLKRAKRILDKDHFGLEEVKDRILEHLAILKLKGDLKAPIICLFGPPGVGKTSLGKSIAKALKRKYIRMSLGGLHDEAEIRGHRKTYIGAMPGRVIQNLKKAKSANPVFVLDEIDKVGADFRGDPAFALLEVLDPEQNETFHDNYLDHEFDLSKVMFIATANSLGSIQDALLDRMELIYVSGYIVEEKVEIAKRHLIPEQLKKHGVEKSQIVLSKDVIKQIVMDYTSESGVRELDQKIAKVIRRIAKKIAMDEEYNVRLKHDDIIDLLGVPEYYNNKYEGNEQAGIATGLAWTRHGGKILFIETSLSNGSGSLSITGNLGSVMRESAILALEYMKSNAEDLEIDPEVFNKFNIHMHIPAGAIPKDGPSAGITMLTSMASLLTQRKIRRNLAMTGEITLRGKVLPVGGIKEKILAAKRADIKELILSKMNEKDINDIKEIYRTGLKFHYVDTISEVLEIALLKQKVRNPKKLR